MSYNNFTEKLLEIQDVDVKILEKTEEEIHIFVEHKRKKCKCPVCGTMTDRIHDYRLQKIKDLPCLGRRTILYDKRCRYRCKECGKRFSEQRSYVSKYARMTNRLALEILDSLADTVSFTYVADKYGVSVSTVIRIFDIINYGKAKLPRTVAIDEFKGNTGGEKYNCIIADPLKHKVLDILPQRQQSYVQNYFIGYSKDERDRVDVFISDMWQPYQDTARTLFRNSVIAVDKYHWSRQIIWAFERVRKQIQRHLPSEKRIYFKRSRSLLIKRFHTLSDDDKQAVNVMLYASADLSTAHFYKEEFQKIIDCKDILKAMKMMGEWIDSAIECGVKPIENCARTMVRWKKEIMNSYRTSCTNGFIEGCNNKIKVLKRVSYGYRNFRRFRNRILYVFSKVEA